MDLSHPRQVAASLPAMVKKRKADASDVEELKKKKVANKKRKDTKGKKKSKDAKKGKKTKSSSSASGTGSSIRSVREVKRRRGEEDDASSGVLLVDTDRSAAVEYKPPEDGILRFTFSADEKGSLGVRFSAGCPPLILAVNPGSFAAKKGVPVNHVVHAINGLHLVSDHREKVMNGLKSRPVILDVRPQGWKPKAMVKELEKKRAMEDAERKAREDAELQRREQVALERKEQEKREMAAVAERQEQVKLRHEALAKQAREQRAQQKAKEEEFRRALEGDAPELRKAASDLMGAEYGTDVQIEGRRGVPLRLFTRRQEVSWLWAGQLQEVIGGGVPDELTPTE